MDENKVVKTVDGIQFYPFDDSRVWKFDTKKEEWVVVDMPDNLVYLEDGDLIELLIDPIEDAVCICSSKDLFHFGCRC